MALFTNYFGGEDDEIRWRPDPAAARDDYRARTFLASAEEWFNAIPLPDATARSRKEWLAIILNYLAQCEGEFIDAAGRYADAAERDIVLALIIGNMADRLPPLLPARVARNQLEYITPAEAAPLPRPVIDRAAARSLCEIVDLEGYALSRREWRDGADIPARDLDDAMIAAIAREGLVARDEGRRDYRGDALITIRAKNKEDI